MTAYPLDNVVTASQGSPGSFSGSWPVILTDRTSAFGTSLNPLFISGAVTVGSIGPVSVIQGTSPWIVSSSLLQNVTGTVAVQGAVSVTQGTSPWVISGSFLQNVSGSVALSQPATVIQGTSPWVVSSSLLNNVTGTVAVTGIPQVTGSVSISQPAIVNQGTNPWVISSSLLHTVTGTVTVTQGIGSQPTNLLPWQVQFADNRDTDAFHRLRVSNPLGLFNSKLIYDSQPLFWDDQQVSGSGTTSTFLSASLSQLMTVSGNVAGDRVRQSFRRLHYQPGKSQMVDMTGVLVAEGGTGIAGVARRMGLFDDLDGFFYEVSGTNVRVATRTNTSGTPVTTYVSQSAWNVDRLDGTGVSGITLDVSKTQLFHIDYQWLGSGRTRFGFYIDGVLWYVHYVLVGNRQVPPVTANPNLPVRYEIQSDGSGPASVAQMQQHCVGVVSEGGQEDVGITISVNTGAAELTTANNTNQYVALAIQMQPGRMNSTIEPLSMGISTSTSNAQFFARLLLNPIVASPLTYIPISNSAVQYATGSQVTTVTGGTCLFETILNSNTKAAGSTTLDLPIDIALGRSIAGVSDTMVLVVQPVPALATNFIATLQFKEQD